MKRVEKANMKRVEKAKQEKQMKVSENSKRLSKIGQFFWENPDKEIVEATYINMRAVLK